MGKRQRRVRKAAGYSRAVLACPAVPPDARTVSNIARIRRVLASPARVTMAVAIVVAAALIARVPIAVMAIDIARHRVAGETAKHRAAEHAAQAAVTDRAADRAAADGAEHGAGRMAMAAAGIGERAGGSRAQRERRRRKKACGAVQHDR